MKYLSIICFSVAIALMSCAQSPNLQQETKRDIVYSARRDSVLLQTDYGSVYYSTDTSCRMYDFFNVSAQLDDDMREAAVDYLTRAKAKGVVVRQFEVGDLCRTWSELYRFNGDYCLFSPSDWMANRDVLITDSLFCIGQTDPSFEIILDHRLVNGVHWFKLKDEYSDRPYFLRILPFDDNRGVAIWEYLDPNMTHEAWELKVQSDKVRMFPMILEDCGDNKCAFPEYEGFFDDPDFESLLKN